MATAQKAANSYARGGSEIERQWNNFRRRNAGRAVWAALARAFHTKCSFCERTNAKTLDHYRPKERYPKRMFRWNNLLLCCSDCNHAKGGEIRFRARVPLLLDPTRDEPLDYFEWDVETGAIIAVADPVRAHRALHTIRQLDLNDRPLQSERIEKLKSIVYILARVVREQPIEHDTRERLQAELHSARPYLGLLRFVWSRETSFRPLVDAARAKLPDIDAWVAPWL